VTQSDIDFFEEINMIRAQIDSKTDSKDTSAGQDETINIHEINGEEQNKSEEDY
jgi:hypothetical protein